MNMLNVSSSPHVRDNSSTRRIMLDVCIALLPACIFGIVNFGMRALAVLVVSVITCVVSEYLFEHFMHRPITVGDLSAVVTGLLLGMNMPHTIPLWIVMLGSVFAIIVVKQLFGGLGQNFMNPALAARCFLLISFAGRMTSFTYDGVTGATPLALLKSGESVNVLSMFLGTTAGAACVFFMKKTLGDLVQRALAGFAAGVMVAASIWSLLIPAIEQAEGMGKLSFLPAFIGFWSGVLFLLLLDRLIPHLHVGSEQAEGPKSKLGRTTMMVLAVTLHNIPEGMAVGVVYAGFLSGNTQITAASALALSLGIAIQNFPEGAIISMPLRAEGERKGRAFLGGVLSGVVEPIGAVLTLLAAQLVIPALPYFLSFAAGAMLYVVVEELIPEMSQGRHSNLGTVFFAVGFSVMMVLDVALG